MLEDGSRAHLYYLRSAGRDRRACVEPAVALSVSRGIGADVAIEFVDPGASGEFHLTNEPAVKDPQPHVAAPIGFPEHMDEPVSVILTPLRSA